MQSLGSFQLGPSLNSPESPPFEEFLVSGLSTLT
jgi:hypothetical protein